MADTISRSVNHSDESRLEEILQLRSSNSLDLGKRSIPAEKQTRTQIGSYRILQEIGAGRMGIVYLAEDAILSRQVALKVLHRSLPSDRSQKEKFLRDVRAAAAMDHDHIVRIFHVDDAGGELFFVMELLKGESLQSRLKREHRLTIKESMRIAKEVAEGLATAHVHGLIHQDITPANLWMESSGRVKILDFGLVHRPDDTSLWTRLSSLSGTPAYMSPEQAAGEQVTSSTDLFSLGCVLYQMLTGEKPFRGETAHDLMRAVVMENPRPLREINPEIPEPLDQLTMQMLSKSERDRPASAQIIADRLQEFIDPDSKKTDSSEKEDTIKLSDRLRVIGVKAPKLTDSEPPSPKEISPPVSENEVVSVSSPPSRYRSWIEHAIASVILAIAATGLVLWWRYSR